MTTLADDSRLVKKDAPKETYHGLQESTQTFPAIGMFEVSGGDVILRGRNGERDHLYPLHKAYARWKDTEHAIMAMAKHAIRGWDTLMDINRDFKAKIIEAVEQRRKLNRPIPKEVLDFVAEQEHEDPKKATVLI